MPDSMDDILHPASTTPACTRFPDAPSGWTEARGHEIAAAEGLELGDDHLEVVCAIQDYFARHEDGRISVRELRDALGERFHQRGGDRYLYLLFPGGPVAQGCRIAGLAVPSGTVDPSFGSVQ